jgi:hypothetical protein
VGEFDERVVWDYSGDGTIMMNYLKKLSYKFVFLIDNLRGIWS